MPNIEAVYSVPDEEGNKAIIDYEEQEFYESVEKEIDQLDPNILYKGNWEHSCHFGWSMFYYAPDVKGNYDYTEVVSALRKQMPYINNNMLMTIREYELGSLSDYPDFREELIDWL
jgi:hypothetical protein